MALFSTTILDQDSQLSARADLKEGDKVEVSNEALGTPDFNEQQANQDSESLEVKTKGKKLSEYTSDLYVAGGEFPVQFLWPYS